MEALSPLNERKAATRSLNMLAAGALIATAIVGFIVVANVGLNGDQNDARLSISSTS